MSPKPSGCADSLYALLGAPAPFDPACTLVTSPVLSPLALAVLRLTLAAYALFVVIFELVHESVVDHTAQT